MSIDSMGMSWMGHAWIIERNKQGFKCLPSNEKISQLPNEEATHDLIAKGTHPTFSLVVSLLFYDIIKL